MFSVTKLILAKAYFMLIPTSIHMLSDRQIREEIESDRLEITDLKYEDQLNPSSVDLTVGPSYKRPATQEVFHAEGGQIMLKPGTFYHLHTVENVNLPEDLHGSTEAIMNVALRGLRVTTGVVDPSFEGRLLIGVENISETTQSLSVGDRIVQLTFERLDSRPESGYEGDTHFEREDLE